MYTLTTVSQHLEAKLWYLFRRGAHGIAFVGSSKPTVRVPALAEALWRAGATVDALAVVEEALALPRIHCLGEILSSSSMRHAAPTA